MEQALVVDQKAPFTLEDIWALQSACSWNRVHKFGVFHLWIDSKLRGCNLVTPRV